MNRVLCVLCIGSLVVLTAGLAGCRRQVPSTQPATTHPTTLPATTQPARARRTRLRSGLSGAWNGTLECEAVQVLGETRSQPNSRPLVLTLVFDENARPQRLPVVGFSGAPLEFVRITQPGETAQVTSNKGDLAITSTVNIVSAQYRRDSFSVQLDIGYSAQAGALQQSGTGTQTIDGHIEGGVLKLSINVEYTVTFHTAAGEFETGEELHCQGTLGPR